jgi:hypothetical protein
LAWKPLHPPARRLHRIVVDEWNLDDLAKSPHIADSRPLGALSAAFMKRVRRDAAARIRARR